MKAISRIKESEVIQSEMFLAPRRESENKVCSQCGGKRPIRNYQRAELICTHCGYVITDHVMDQGPEWRAFNKEDKDKKVRTGPPPTFTLHDKGLSTSIDWRDHDIRGKNFSPQSRAQIYRLRQWQRFKLRKGSERSLILGLAELKRLASFLGLPENVRETAALIYRQVRKKQLIMGRTIEETAGAVVYIACRKCKVLRTLNEVAEVSGLSKEEVSYSYRAIARKLFIHLPSVSLTDYISRFASELKLSGEVEFQATEILKKARQKGCISGRSYSGMAAAIIYIAAVLCGQRRTQLQIAKVAKVTEVTVRNRYKELCEKLGIKRTIIMGDLIEQI